MCGSIRLGHGDPRCKGLIVTVTSPEQVCIEGSGVVVLVKG